MTIRRRVIPLWQVGAVATTHEPRSHQLQSLQTRMAVLADDDVVMHGDAERPRDVDDGAGHLDVRLRWRRIAGRVIVQDALETT
jgi:hypothetical protein